jgi:hypothetical protein
VPASPPWTSLDTFDIVSCWLRLPVGSSPVSLPIYCIYESDTTHSELRPYYYHQAWRRLSQCYLILVTLYLQLPLWMGWQSSGYKALIKAGVEIYFV